MPFMEMCRVPSTHPIQENYEKIMKSVKMSYFRYILWGENLHKTSARPLSFYDVNTTLLSRDMKVGC